MKNYPGCVFNMTNLLESLGVKSAMYVHTGDVRQFCEKYWFIQYAKGKTKSLRY